MGSSSDSHTSEELAHQTLSCRQVTADGTRSRVVFVHGFTQTSRCWGHIGVDLAEDHEIMLVDAPGHGGSAEIQVGLNDAARLITGVGGTATYVGYSLGGRIALHAALGYPHLVERLVLISATAGLDHEADRLERIRSDETLAEHLESIGLEEFIDEWLDNPLFSGLQPAAAHRDERLANTVSGLASSLRCAGTGTQEPLWPRLGEITIPVLVVAGANDMKFSALARRLVECTGPNATLAIIPDAGHTAHLERPAEFTDLLRAWLEHH